MTDRAAAGRRFFPSEEKHALVGLACTLPSERGRPDTHWSTRALALEAAADDIVKSISAETIRTWLASMALKPHRSRYWLNSQDPDFTAMMRDIVNLYLDPPPNSVVLCYDERTGMQALERSHPTKPMVPGYIERREFEYIRHGTMDLLAALDVHSGEVFGACYERHTQYEVADFFEWILPQMPREKEIHLVMDNLRVHKTEAVTNVLESFGKKLHVHWTPNHASWLNQIEIFFSILSRRVLRRGNFTGKRDLADKVDKFIRHYVLFDAKPFRWTYTGQPLHN